MLVACVARAVSYPIYRLKIPRIVGDIIAGCLLGPTVLQDAQLYIFPPENRPLLKAFGTFGLILASATSGAAFDRNVLVGQRLKVVVFAVLNIGITFASCFALLLFFPTTSEFVGPNYIKESYEVYFGSAITSASLPMAFLILDELKMRNNLARFLIGASTIGTILLFTLASIANSFATRDSSIFGPFLAIFRICCLIALLLFLWPIQYFWQLALRKEMHRWFWRTSTDQSVLILTLCIASSVVTERLGYTFILGAFFAGAFLPSPVLDPLGDEGKAGLIRANFPKLIKYVSRWIMLPCFFLDIGLQFDIRYIGADWGWVAVALVWGTVFKMLLIPICYFGFKMTWNDSCFSFSLAQCRGFNALIIGAAALEVKQFGPATFTISVLFSVFSSCLAGWLCQVFHSREQLRLSKLDKRTQEEAEATGPTPLDLHFAVQPFYDESIDDLVGQEPSPPNLPILPPANKPAAEEAKEDPLELLASSRRTTRASQHAVDLLLSLGMQPTSHGSQAALGHPPAAPPPPTAAVATSTAAAAAPTAVAAAEREPSMSVSHRSVVLPQSLSVSGLHRHSLENLPHAAVEYTDSSSESLEDAREPTSAQEQMWQDGLVEVLCDDLLTEGTSILTKPNLPKRSSTVLVCRAGALGTSSRQSVTSPPTNASADRAHATSPSQPPQPPLPSPPPAPHAEDHVPGPPPAP
eukprot:EG_transcript_2441